MHLAHFNLIFSYALLGERELVFKLKFQPLSIFELSAKVADLCEFLGNIGDLSLPCLREKMVC